MIKKTKLAIFFTFIGVFTRPLGISLYQSSIPAVQTAFQATSSQTQLTIGIFFLTQGVSQLIFGPLSDRYGRKKILMLGLAFFIASSILCIFSQNIQQFLILRAIQGIGLGAEFTVTNAMIVDLFKKGKILAIAIGWMCTVFSVASILLPIIGGFVQTYFNWQIVFALMAFYTITISVGMYFGIEEHSTKEVKKINFKQIIFGYIRMYTDRSNLFFILTIATVPAFFALFQGVTPIFIQSQLGYSPGDYGLLSMNIGIGYLLGSIVNLILLKWLNIRINILFGFAILLISSLFMLQSASLDNLNIYSLLIPETFIMIGSGLITGNIMEFVLSKFNGIAGIANANVGFIIYAGAGGIEALLAHYFILDSFYTFAMTSLSLTIISIILYYTASLLTHRKLRI